jgi:hypothetical protein
MNSWHTEIGTEDRETPWVEAGCLHSNPEVKFMESDPRTVI